MAKFKFGNIVKEVKINVDRANNPYEFYVAGDHMDTEDLVIRRRGKFATDDVGPAFTRIFKPGQILYGSRRTYLKKVAVADFEGICANTTFVLETKDSNVLLQELLPYIMLSDSFTEWSVSHSKGSTNPYVLFSDLAEFEVELPSIAEQRVLSNKLLAAQRVKESYRRLLIDTDELVKSQFIEMFGDQNSNDRHWPEALIKDEFVLNMGKTPARANQAYWSDEGLKWISIADMAKYEKYTGDTAEHISQLAVDRCGIKCVEPGTIIMSFKLSIGRTAITSERIYTNEAIMAFNGLNTKKFDKDFLYYAFSTKDWLIDAKKAVKGATLNKESIGNSKIIVPPLYQQSQFAAILNQADKSKFELKKSIEKIENVITALIQQGIER